MENNKEMRCLHGHAPLFVSFLLWGVMSAHARVVSPLPFVKEFGHVLQFRKIGAVLYYDVIAKESLQNCAIEKIMNIDIHSTYWTETWANYLSKKYFGNKWLGTETLVSSNKSLYYPSKNPSKLLLYRKFGLWSLFF